MWVSLLFKETKYVFQSWPFWLVLEHKFGFMPYFFHIYFLVVTRLFEGPRLG